MVILKGGKIRLMPLKQKDIPFVVRCNLDPEVLKWTANSGPLDMKRKRAATKKIGKNIGNIAKNKSKDKQMFIVEVKNGKRWKPIGDCELSDINKLNKSAVFAICIEPNYWQKGYGTEATKLLFAYAFKKMHLHRIESHVTEFNTQSLMFHEKFGFVKEGCQKEAKFQNGRFWDRIIFRLLESEWKNIDKNRQLTK